MSFTSNSDHLLRRNARSFDLDHSATKAAAWVWHLHTSNPGITTEGRFICPQTRRRSSGNYGGRATRFQQEASTTAPHGSRTETPVWDCGSAFYDTFELVAFGNRLDRSLMEAVPMTPPQARRPREHHTKSPLHEPNVILRTMSLPRSLPQEASKKGTSEAGKNADKLKQGMLYGRGRRAISTGTGQKTSTRWSRVGKLMNVIKKVVVLHKQVNFVGCKRSSSVIEYSQRPIDPISKQKDGIRTRDNHVLVNQKVRALSASDIRDTACAGDDLSIQYPKVRFRNGLRGNYKPYYEFNNGDLASLQDKIKANDSESFGSVLRSNSESTLDGFSFENEKIIPRRKRAAHDQSGYMDNRIKESNLEGINANERSGGANEHADHFEHTHHHHHHHHHHHYLHHHVASESARLSPETMSKLCVEQSRLVSH